MKTFTITTHHHDGAIERSLVSAANEEEARAKFESRSTEWIVSIHEVRHPA